jgi:hypothetical protein
MMTAGAGEARGIAAETLLRPGSIAVSDLPNHFDVEPGFHNLEAGYWSPMPRIVAQAYARHNAAVNGIHSIWARNVLADVPASRRPIAPPRPPSPGRWAAYKLLKPGDAVIHCDLDYDVMIAAMKWLGSHRGANVVSFAMPEPATAANILAAY